MKKLSTWVMLTGLIPKTTGCSIEIADGDIDLDTTYFPFGLGYEWCYERHDYGFEITDTIEEWDSFDTVIIKTLDSLWVDGELLFQIENDFYDLGNPVRLYKNKITLSTYLDDEVKVIPEEAEKTETTGDDYYQTTKTLKISHLQDTLLISSSSASSITKSGIGVRRIIGIGTIVQSSSSETFFGIGANEYEQDICYRLLYFYNGQDTVYKTD
ncbi:hypothetical protein JXM67_12405 [candidate division WOR-3 bacterium]|nr:hypothetical protein [candidate division WOR-3 bacterium]